MNKTIIKSVSVAVVVIAIAGAYMFPKIQTQLGALPGSDILTSFLSVNGFRTEYRSRAFGTGTTTPCVLRAPTDATSTLVFASLTIRTASSTATTWTAAKATSPNATTTVLTTFPALGSGAQGTMIASTTPFTTVAGDLVGKPDIDVATVFAPGQYLVWGVAGLNGSYDATKLAGQCKAEFKVNSAN